MTSKNALHPYLADHMARSEAASDLAKRGADNNEGPAQSETTQVCEQGKGRAVLDDAPHGYEIFRAEADGCLIVVLQP